MEDLLGPTVLQGDGTLVPTPAALQDKGFVLLYFSASWCPPCKAFTPVLKKFYETVTSSEDGQGKLEIIFISSDKSAEAFKQYFATMPWLSVPPAKESAKYCNDLSKALFINSIPSLVVMTSSGLYVSNSAKADVASAMSSGGDSNFMELLEKWNQIEPVPIKDANLGIVSTIFSSLKKGYNYVRGSNDSSESLEEQSVDDACDVDDDKEEGEEIDVASPIPPEFLLSFFQNATSRLDSFPNESVRPKLFESIDSDQDDYLEPVSLGNHRAYLLEEQVHALRDSVSEYNELSAKTITAEDAQQSLRALGANTYFSSIGSTDEDHEELLSAMATMNDAARMAFARAVLYSEVSWSKRYESPANLDESQDDGDKIPMTNVTPIDYKNVNRYLQNEEDAGDMGRKDAIEFCGLCSAAIRLPEVANYLVTGDAIFPEQATDGEVDEVKKRATRAFPQQRVLKVQHMMLCAVGYEPDYGGLELRKLMSTIDTENSDNSDLTTAISTFMLTMQSAAKAAIIECAKEGLSDENDGGVTRVVDVKYSEKTLNKDGVYTDTGDAPSHETMEQQTEEQQREGIRMAQQAANLQKEIMNELMALDEEQRKNQLDLAKEAHETFLKEALAVPPQERVVFMQNVGAEKQRMLLMHKLWESRSPAS